MLSFNRLSQGRRMNSLKFPFNKEGKKDERKKGKGKIQVGLGQELRCVVVVEMGMAGGGRPKSFASAPLACRACTD